MCPLKICTLLSFDEMFYKCHLGEMCHSSLLCPCWLSASSSSDYWERDIDIFLNIIFIFPFILAIPSVFDRISIYKWASCKHIWLDLALDKQSDNLGLNGGLGHLHLVWLLIWWSLNLSACYLLIFYFPLCSIPFPSFSDWVLLIFIFLMAAPSAHGSS